VALPGEEPGNARRVTRLQRRCEFVEPGLGQGLGRPGLGCHCSRCDRAGRDRCCRDRRCRDRDRYDRPDRHVPADRVLYVAASTTCLAFVVLVLVGAPLEVASVACAGVLVAVVAARNRALLSWRLLPIRLLAFVTGLFLLVQTLDRLALGPIVSNLVGSDGGALGVIRAALTGAGLSNLINNLPSYVVGEAAVPVENQDQLLGLLIGTNVGPLVTPWASLAILLWADRCRAAGLEVNWRRFVGTGAVTATVVLICSVGALLATS